MSRRKGTPERSSLQRERPLAYARRQRGDGGADTPANPDQPDDTDDKDENDDNAAVAKSDAAAPSADPSAAAGRVADAAKPTDAVPAAAAVADTATPIDDQPVAAPAAAAPPEAPAAPPVVAAPVAAPKRPATAGATGVEDPTSMPSARAIPGGDPDDPAPAPGLVPAGDSRSYRRGHEFALVYRTGTFLISRTGTVGTRGVWRVVEYPTPGSASNSYARECSRLQGEGYSDYRE